MSAKEWQKKCEQQQKQLELIEKRLRDVIKAYKGLEAEKKSLEEVVIAWKENEKGEDEGKNDGEQQPSTSLALPAKPTLETLKQAFASLTKEKIRRESALQTDKKTLLNELDVMREKVKQLDQEKKEKEEQLNKTIAQAEADADKFEKLVKDQHEKMVMVKKELERERTGHGQSVAAMQTEYAKERMQVEQLNKKLAEAYTRMHTQEQVPDAMKKREKDLKDEITLWKRQCEEWREKATKTPCVQLLQDQLTNMKMEHERELTEAVSNAMQKTTTDTRMADRVHEVEEGLQRMASQLAETEGKRVQAEEETRMIREENAALNDRLDKLRETGMTTEDPVERLKAAIVYARGKRADVDVRELLGGDSTAIMEMKTKYERLKDEFERYKLKAEAVLKSKQPKEDVPSEEEEGLRLLVTQLHDKLRSLEVAHATDQATYEKETRNLRERVSELERSEENTSQEMRREMTARVSEMEEEMTKQRERTLEVLAEKERELEAIRSILISLRSDQLTSSVHNSGTGNAPADPITTEKAERAAKITTNFNRKSGEWRKYAERKTSTESHRRSMGSACSVKEVDETHRQISLPMGNESRNIYYEEELSKKEREINDLRGSVHQIDYRMREMEQNYVCRDLQHHEQSEKLKEEIRVLEGKLALSQQSESGNSEYLRNIFVQYLNCDNSNGRKSILKAIGTVLRLSLKEMKLLEKRT